MAAVPLFEEASGSAAGPLIADLAGIGDMAPLVPDYELTGASRPSRSLAIYGASAGFDLVSELEFLAGRTIEPNVFFNPRFLAPAMPRLEDREVRLAVIRDGDETRNRLRFLVPFSVERPPVPLGVSIIRTWSSPYGPLGTPLVDRDDPVGVIEDFFEILARPTVALPSVIVFPDLRLDAPVARLLRTVAIGRNLPVFNVNEYDRPILRSESDGDDYLKAALSSHHWRDFKRLRRRLAEKGELVYDVARNPEDVRMALENFLSLEQSGWKGRQRTAMASDRYRAAFAREAVNDLARMDKVRMHTFTLDGATIASLVVFIDAGTAYTWKTAFDERFAAFSPGTLLMMDATRTHLDDPNIETSDSCSTPDHPVMSRLWAERERMGTLVIGLTHAADRSARQAATQLHLYSETRALARRVRDRLFEFVRR